MRLALSPLFRGSQRGKFAGYRPSQPTEIINEMKKRHSTEHFYLTVSCWGGYLAASSPSGCGGKEAASAIPCGILVDKAWTTWGRAVDSVRVEVRLVGGMLWH